MESLMRYPWSGNIRELQNAIERSVVIANGPMGQIDDSMLRANVGAEESKLATVEQLERNHTVRALAEANWLIHGKRGAAEILGINPSTLRSRMEKLGIRRQA
jgi:DNA-binding NtrC family response regulator